jgi:hypothetical protein
VKEIDGLSIKEEIVDVKLSQRLLTQIDVVLFGTIKLSSRMVIVRTGCSDS